MNNEVILTIVIPSYNSSRYMEKSLPTFMHKELEGKIEVLIISDGSTDDTVEHARKYEKKSSIFKTFSKENGGHGSVINYAVKIAQGQYFRVVDADDWVITENLVKFVDFLKKNKADIVVSPYIAMNVSKSNKKKMRGILKLKNSVNYIFDQVVDRIPSMAIHGFTIKTSILKENNIKLTEKCFYDDFQYVTYPVAYINTICYLKYPVVNYLIGQKTQSVSSESVYRNRNMHKQILFDSIDNYLRIVNTLSLEKRAFFVGEIIRLVKSNYIIFIRNYKKESAWIELRIFDKELKEKSLVFYRACGKKYKYIGALQNDNKFLFNIIGFLLSL